MGFATEPVMNAAFDPAAYPPGSKHALDLPLHGAAHGWNLPILLVPAARPVSAWSSRPPCTG